MPRKRPPVALCWTALLAVGCYTYVPTSLETVPVGTDIRALVSTEGQVRLLNDFGLDTRSLAGTLEVKEAERVRVAVRALYTDPRLGTPTPYQHVELLPRDLLRVEVKRFDGLKTGGFLGLLVGSATAVVVMAATGVFEGGAQPPPGGQPPAR